MNLRPIFGYLSETLTGGSPSSAGLDWELVVRVASDELVLPLLYDRVTGAPREIVGLLKGVRDVHAERNEVFLEELRFAGELANAIGIEPVVLKGGAQLLKGLYVAVSERYLVDIDLLVPEDAVPALVERFLANGYSFDESTRVGVDCHHVNGLKRPGRPGVEIHRSLGMGRTRVLLPAAEVIRESEEVEHRGAVLRLPSDRHLLIHHVLHAQLGNSYQQAVWPGLREAYDCWLLAGRLSASGKLTGLMERCRKDRRYGFVLLHMRTVQEILGTPFPPPSMGMSERLQWVHRKVLREFPWVRFVDPWYFLRSSVTHRVARLRDLCGSAEGWRYVMGTPFRASFYRNVFKELF